MGLGAEASYWYQHHRAMQNAADAAAIAAAMNGGAGYDTEAKAVAAQYGFINGGNTTVSVSNSGAATGCASNCYTVTITDNVQLIFAKIIGYAGNTTLNNNGSLNIVASSVAQSSSARQYCILSLASSGAQGITSNGRPNADLQGCNVMSDTTATCNGHNLNATFGDAAGSNSGCGVTQHSNVPKVADSYAGTASNIPANTCNGTYPQEPAKKKDPALPASNQWSGTQSFYGNNVVCGDLQLTGNTTVTGDGGVLVIENGLLDLNGYTLTTSGLTIVFSGSDSSSYQHIPTGSGVLDMTAPTSGAWSGIAIYQDPALTTNINISYAGNSPTWNITGLVYLPHASVTISGAVGKSGTGANCFALVDDNITINGTGSIFANDTQCAAAGLAPPSGGTRGGLTN